jgi:serine/threonine protein kinase
MAEKIGRFEILGEISRGPMACVYKASDTESGQVVALKTVRLQDLGDQAPVWVQRVLEEAENTKAVNSPNIVLLYGAGDIGDHFCAAVEYVQGNSIANMLARQEHFSIWDLQDIARQTCQGLDHAHARRIVHYSLEPAKIMVSWEGTVKILGLGISQMGAGLAYASGMPPAVLHYMSPEQVRGETLDARSNIFTLGAILYEMVTDRKAFGGEDAEQVRQEILNGMPVPPAMILSKIVPGLSEVIMRALSKIPEQRYASAKELINDLDQCRESSTGPLTARKPPEPVRGLNIPQASAMAAQSVQDPRATQSSAAGQPSRRSRPKAAAAAAGSDHSGESISGFSLVESLPVASASAFSSEAEVETFDPPHLTGDDRSTRPPSFSEIEELPPLKEAYVSAPTTPVSEPGLETVAPPEALAPREKPKMLPRELVKRVVLEIQKTPPKLFLYSIGAAVLIILLIIASIGHRIRSQNSEDEVGAPAAGIAEPAAQRSPTPALPPASIVGTPSTATPSAPPETIKVGKSRKPEIISVIPRHNRRRESRPRAPEPVVVPGELTVNSTPEGAAILVDGKGNADWATPNHISGIAPGKHTVNISKSGYISETRTIEVASGSKSFLVVQLAPAGASAFISSVPPGAQVLVDGKDASHITPVQVQVQKPGPHTFLVRKPGYLDESVTANLQSGQAFQFAPVLRQLGRTDDIRYAGRFKKLFGGGDSAGTGTVTVKTDPRGAQIMVNHKMLDRLSPVQFYLNPGTYVIDITLSGYKSVRRVLNVDKDGKFTIDETLEQQ